MQRKILVKKILFGFVICTRTVFFSVNFCHTYKFGKYVTGCVTVLSLLGLRRSEKQIQNALTISNTIISSVIPDTLSINSVRAIRHMFNYLNGKDFDVSSVLHGNIKKK